MKEPQTNNRSQTIGTTSTVIAKQQDSGTRTFISITNNSKAGEIIYITDGEEAEIGKGFPISPGGYYIDSLDNNVKPSQRQINAIATAATATVSIMEKTIPGVL